MITLDLSSPRYPFVPRERAQVENTDQAIVWAIVDYAHAHKISVRDVDARLWREEVQS